MEYINIGKYVNTHGIKGEIRILSNFSRKELVFKKDNYIYIGENKLKFKIKSVRKHKNYDMVTLYDIDNINDIEHLKQNLVYFNKDELKEEFLLENIYEYKVLIKKECYNITEIIENKLYKIIVLENGKMIPLIDEFITIDQKNKEVIVKEEMNI